MRAFYLHDESPLDPASLEAQGIHTDRLELGAHDPAIAALMARAGYLERDEVQMRPTTPDLDALCAKFADEHHHDDDEVRFVLEGEGIFDIRSRDDRWMRVVVSPGDLLVVPAGRHHRFLLTDARTIRCVRLFRDRQGWVPHSRGGA